MQRLVFYGFIILSVIIAVALVDVIIYWMLRLFLSRPMARRANLLVIIIGLGTLGISAWWGHTRTRLDLMVTHTEVTSTRLPEAFDGYQIAQISDFHLDSFGLDEGRDFIARLVQALEEQQPDVIVFTGDLVTLRAAEGYPFREALSAIGHIDSRNGEGCIPVYCILGNHDYADYVRGFDPNRRAQDVDSLIALQETSGWHMLRNTSLPLTRIGHDSVSQHIFLAGVENIGEPPFSIYGDLGKALEPVGGKAMTDSTFTILLSHNPTHWRREVLPETHIDLMLAGHTHATQVLIGSWSPAQWKYDEWMGLYTEGDQHLYVNTGLGCVGPAVRIGIRPEVSIITLRSR